jgi:hypothetical protein
LSHEDDGLDFRRLDVIFARVHEIDATGWDLPHRASFLLHTHLPRKNRDLYPIGVMMVGYLTAGFHTKEGRLRAVGLEHRTSLHWRTADHDLRPLPIARLTIRRHWFAPLCSGDTILPDYHGVDQPCADDDANIVRDCAMHTRPMAVPNLCGPEWSALSRSRIG